MSTTNHQHPLWQLLDAMQMDLRQMNARMTELRAQISQVTLDTPTTLRCTTCDYTTTSRHELEAHGYYHHDGPLPALWKLADLRAEAAA